MHHFPAVSNRSVSEGLFHVPMLPSPTMTRKERYLLAAAGQEVDRPPVWIMRQAGRYMPQYMKLRETYSFRDLCLNPQASTAASMLPLQLLDVDVLIIFNDILIPLEAMGLRVEFPETGPQIMEPPRTAADIERMTTVDQFDHPPVTACLQALRAQAGEDIPILGFAGCPFTLASYAVEGKMSRHQHVIKAMVHGQPALLHALLEKTTTTAAAYLVAQIQQGSADGVQIFESQAPALAPADYEEFAARYQRRLIQKVKDACPATPITLYARGSAAILGSMAASGADVVSIDWAHTLASARQQLDLQNPAVALQGNLDPTLMIVPDAVETGVQQMLAGFNWRRGFIANLGHGIIPQGTVDGARRFIDAIKALGQ